MLEPNILIKIIHLFLSEKKCGICDILGLKPSHWGFPYSLHFHVQFEMSAIISTDQIILQYHFIMG